LGDKIGKGFFSCFDNFVEASRTRFNYFNGFKEKWLPIFYNGVTISSKFEARPGGEEGGFFPGGHLGERQGRSVPFPPSSWKFLESSAENPANKPQNFC
jgi:hypothetical protein